MSISDPGSILAPSDDLIRADVHREHLNGTEHSSVSTLFACDNGERSSHDASRHLHPARTQMLNRRRNRLSAILAIALAGPSISQAQETADKVFAALATDSTAWQRVLVYTVEALSTQLVASATDPAAQPWRLQLPSDDPQAGLITTQLRTILRARQVMPGDTLVRTLQLGPLVIAGDTARVEVRYAETRKCPGTGKSTGSGWWTTVLVPREPQHRFWGAARSLTTSVGDRAPC